MTLFAFLYTMSLLKKGFSKRKTTAPQGNKFFPFKADSFLEGNKNNFDRAASPKSVSIPLKVN